MHSTIKIFILFLLFISNVYAANILCIESYKSFSGTIIDKVTQQPISGAVISIPEIHKGTISDEKGNFNIDQLPSTIIFIQISYPGYKQITDKLDLNIISERMYQLEEWINELNEVVVTGLSKSGERNRTPLSITTISSSAMSQLQGNNIIDVIAKTPGVSQITSGAAISKPVIRGLSYNRVVIVNDEVRQEGQQWGDEHGIEVDEFSVHRVEILKGPASLSYGSDALAGVVHFISAPTATEAKPKGNILFNYQTNNGTIASAQNIAGNKNGFNYYFLNAQKYAHDYKNSADGAVYNSRFRESTQKLSIGLNRVWGYSHVQLSRYQLKPGIVEGERDSTSGTFLKLNSDGNELLVETKDGKDYSIAYPYQDIQHYKAVLNQHILLHKGSLKTIVAYQQNRRNEFADPVTPSIAALSFRLHTINYDIKYLLPEINQFSTSIGLNGMYQNSLNKGEEFVIPEYNLFDYGIYSIVNRPFRNLDFNIGIRADQRKYTSDALYLNESGMVTNSKDSFAIEKFPVSRKSFQGISASAGFAWQIKPFYYLKCNLARGYRSPNVIEISANGVHEGTNNYLIGNQNLQAENSVQLDISLGIDSKHLSSELNLFQNNIKHFIFLEKLNSLTGMDSLIEGNIAYQYKSNAANLYGMEFTFDIHPHPLDWLHIENSFSLVEGKLKDATSSYLPSLPQTKFNSEIEISKAKCGKWFKDFYFNINGDYYFARNKIYSKYNTETASPAYFLLNAGTGIDCLNAKKKVVASFSIQLTNITDKAYQNHLNRFKYLPINYNNNKTGVFDVGRNLLLKLIVPFTDLL